MLQNRVSLNFREAFIETFKPRPACPLCGEVKRTESVSFEIRTIPLRFAQCLACNLVYQDPMPSLAALKDYFDSREFINDGGNTDDLRKTMGYYNYDAWDVSYAKTAAARLSKIRRWAPPPGRLLEIGSATGSFLDEARRRGYDASGLDVSAQFAEIARGRYGVNVDNGFIEEYPLKAGEFDVICAFGGIACWWDPRQAMRNIRQALKPGGTFVLNFSDVSSLPARISGRDYPEYNHASLVVYSRQTMHRLLRQGGFEVLYDRTEWQYANVERIITYWRSNTLWRLATRLGLSQWMLRVPAVGTRFVVCRDSRS